MRGQFLSCAAAIVVLAAASGSVNAQPAPSPVVFPSEAVPFLRPANSKQTMLFRPSDGAGPFPAVILLPTCGGMAPHVLDWAERLTKAGYVALTVESNMPRGIAVSCNRNPRVKYDDVAADAAAALEHLRNLPLVKRDSIGLMGFSYGAGAGLRLASGSYRKRMGLAMEGLRAIASFYPRCYPSGEEYVARGARRENLTGDIVTPTMLLLGAKDDESAASECVTRVDRISRDGKPISYKLYPDTTHAFDDARNGIQGRSIPSDRGSFFYRYSPQATEDAWIEVKALFDRELRGGK